MRERTLVEYREALRLDPNASFYAQSEKEHTVNKRGQEVP